MAVKIRKAFVVMPDSLNDDQRYIFHGIDRAEAEEICLAFVEELLDDDIQMCQRAEHYPETTWIPDWWKSVEPDHCLCQYDSFVYETSIYDFGH